MEKMDIEEDSKVETVKGAKAKEAGAVLRFHP